MERIAEQLKSTTAHFTDRNNRLPAASRIEEFAINNGISRSQAYKEIAAGRLIARKVAGRTIILPEDEQSWRDSLPKLQPRAA